ncbi:MAG: ATP-binding protein [Candidatus Heimdallarchaeota archaeon]|nr:MAG: ATP-binding protein [Candidatus Heimdallarchaeota archaeon]
MELIKSSTSEISFYIDTTKVSIYEQDFILITDSKKTPQQQYLAQITHLIQTKGEEIKGTAIILGEIDSENFSLSPCKFPISSQAQIQHPPKGLVSKIISYRGDQGIYLGDVVTFDKNTDPFLISPKFLERHVLCVASTGAGKSYSVGVLLEEIIMKFNTAAVLLFDIHNEYWGLAQPNDGIEIEQLDYEDYSPRGFQDNILLFEKDSLGLGERFDLPRLRRLTELTAAQENSLSNIITEPILLEELISLIQDSDIHSSTRETLISKIYSLKNLNLFEKELDLENLIRPGQISIVRLDKFVDDRKCNLLVNEILTQVFEKKIQGDLVRENEIVLVIEEAHRFATTNEILTKISREGRKFGIYEILISQRPADFPDNIIANMNTLIALRIRSDKDMNKIRLMEGISTEIVSRLPHLIRGEALIVGLQRGSQSPIKIRVRPRLTKHIDPQEDKMPETIPRYEGMTKIIQLKAVSDLPTDEFSTTTLDSSEIELDESKPLTREIEAFSYKDLTNLLACKHILILHKRTGICIFDLGITMLKIDPQLVSGFLSAISGLFSELKEDLVKERTILRIFTEEIGDRAFKIVTVEGTNSVAAVILDRTPKYLNILKRRIRNFSYDFETEFGTILEEFVGVMDDFAPTIEILDQHLGLSLITPLQINRSYKGEISHPELFEIIRKQVDQLAITEGLFAQEIVNQCLLDSDFNFREITEVIISYLQEKVLVLLDQNRTLPRFVSTLPPADLQQPKLEETLSEEPTLPEVSEYVSDEPIEIGEVDINWFTTLIPEIQTNSLPESLISDILERDLIFESEFRIKATSIHAITYSESDLLRWATLMSQKGFEIYLKATNPLNGVKITLKTDLTTIICSIAQLNTGDYCFIIGEVE